jgi:hypothetical protein
LHLSRAAIIAVIALWSITYEGEYC